MAHYRRIGEVPPKRHTQFRDGEGRLYTLLSKYRLFSAANFKFVAVGVFEKKTVVTWTVFLANFRPLKIFPASVAHKFRDPINFFACVRPERDSRLVWTMRFTLIKGEKFQRPIASPSIKRIRTVTRTFVAKTKLG